MKHIFYLVLFVIISEYCKPTEGQCSGGMWPIQDASIGSFTVFWRYNAASNTIQFIIQGQATSTINLASTYIALGWSSISPTMDNADIAFFYLGSRAIEDRYVRGRTVPSLDVQQDLCLIRTNITDSNIYFTFERFVSTGDTNDTDFMTNVYLLFALGSYTFTATTNTFSPRYHSYRTASQASTSLMTCVSTGCSSTTCAVTSCPCLQQIGSTLAQCVCFTASPCVSGSTVTPRTSVTTIGNVPLTTSASSVLTGSCQGQSNPCSANGVCLQLSSTQITCQCRNDYTGVLCQIPLFSNNITNTSLCQCVNGGSCLANGLCLCSSLYQGRFCQLNNPCVDYCRNNGTCSVACTDISCGLPSCTCRGIYTGTRCESVANDPCQLNPCVNGICIPFANGTYQCQCLNGFFGTRCDFINSCLSSPCNQGICVPSSNCFGSICGYSCICPNETTGINCEIGSNPCRSGPCRNGATCFPLSNTYLCQCSSSYGGTNCEFLINVCTPNPCLNNGVCVRSSTIQDGTFRCECINGYTGARCEYASGCISSPCRNNGQCVSSTANCTSTMCPARCICLTGTTGTFCEQLDTSCFTNPCLNGGICTVNTLTNTPYCQCPINTIGSRCETIQSQCTNATCSNNGACFIDGTSGVLIARCACFPGYSGQYCQTSINSMNICSQSPCGLYGTCIATSILSYYCICPNGLIGQTCNSNTITSCASSPCHYLATCQPVSNTNPTSYVCLCPNYLTGDRCQYANVCQRQPCQNQGTCLPLGPQNNFLCSCQPGYGNYDCSIYLGLTCNANICLNGGTCDVSNGNIRCICPNGFAGARCEWISVCAINTCLNGATCRQIGATIAECLCTTGFAGPTCNLRDSCTNFPCKNGAACTALYFATASNWSAYRCICPPGLYGQNCDTTINSCATIVCPSYKICSEQPRGPVCTCPGNQVGTFCQYTNPCSMSALNYCLNGGTCVSSNTDPPVAMCLCPDGFRGSNCNLIALNNPCSSNPCRENGYCAVSPSNTSYSCICQSNFVGDQCERSNPCASSPCLNQAVCQPFWNITNTWYKCRCVGTYTGINCETSLLNPCSGLCMNGSPCVNGLCVCPPQYTGTFCGLDNPCYYPICRNGGFCTANFNATSVSPVCTCASTFTGQYCETSIYAQGSTNCQLPCLNGGSCVNGVCMCRFEYVGPQCQYQNPCLYSNPCLNGGTCFGRYNINGTVYSQCFCYQGYTGMYCETPLCSPLSCNGGICTATQNTFVCACPAGKVGDRCQYVDLCATNPCSVGQRCEQIQNRYQCVACYDRSTFCSIYQTRNEYCDNRYTLLVGGTYIPVLDACQLSCRQCISTPQSNIARSLNGLADENASTIAITSEVQTSDATDIGLGSTFIASESTTVKPSTTTSTTTTTKVFIGQNIIFSRAEKCNDKREDCLIQKTFGFCEIFNDRYPHRCPKTCNPNCAFES